MPINSHIFLPFEGVPAGLGPGLRTVSGAKVSNKMAVSGFLGLEEHFNPIDAAFLALRGVPRGGLPRPVQEQWHRRPLVPRSPERSITIVSRPEAALDSGGIARQNLLSISWLRSDDCFSTHIDKSSVAHWFRAKESGTKAPPKAATLRTL